MAKHSQVKHGRVVFFYRPLQLARTGEFIVRHRFDGAMLPQSNLVKIGYADVSEGMYLHLPPGLSIVQRWRAETKIGKILSSLGLPANWVVRGEADGSRTYLMPLAWTESKGWDPISRRWKTVWLPVWHTESSLPLIGG